ncbi:hypothetical protein V1478_001972 [Vespula squamosa]|uniref:Uncharacterized protein n=1 Tax=Vespula squamosa TaxID=30214 RepID=A0ABD2BYM9_VESSQ
MSCDPLTNSDLRERISAQPIMCTSSQRTKPLPGIGRFRVPPLQITCVPYTNSDSLEGISAEPIAYTFPENDTITRATSTNVMRPAYKL